MRNRALGAILVLLSIGLAGSVRGQSEDPMQSLKDSLSGDQQGSLLQGILGKGNGSNKKTDEKLQTPETVQQKTDQTTKDFFDKNKKEKTTDGRILRQYDEDPELRADDTVLIDVTPISDICDRYANGQGIPNANNGNPNGGVTEPPAPHPHA